MTTLPAPADLARLIDAYLAAPPAARAEAHYALLRWGMQKRARYVHPGAGVAASVTWGTLNVIAWPPEAGAGPDRLAPGCRAPSGTAATEL
jgi:hypothetical protein